MFRPFAGCPLCDCAASSRAGLIVHLRRHHALGPGSRAASVAIELSRARARGWPTERMEAELARLVEERGPSLGIPEGAVA